MSAPANAVKNVIKAANVAANAAANAVTPAKTPFKMSGKGIFIVGIIVLLILTGLILFYVFSWASKDTLVSDGTVAATLAKQRASLEAITMSAPNSFYNAMNQPSSPVYLAEDEQYLINLCPLTASISGYIGPLADGVFDINAYLQKAFAAGIRSFVLPISTYYDDNKMAPNWPLSGSPAIVYRDANGTIQSLNGLTVAAFCEALMLKKATNPAQANEPILLYLHGIDGHIPDPKQDELKYVNFTSSIAQGLASLDPKNGKTYRLTTAEGVGSVVGGANQSTILTNIPLTKLQNKILIFTNFDVSVGMKNAYSKIHPRLSDYTNFVYSPLSSAKKAGNAYSIHMSDITADYTAEYNATWLATLQDPLDAVPSATDVNNAIGICVQCIPLPLISTGMPPSLAAIYSQWGGYAFRVREGSPRTEGFQVAAPSRGNTRFKKPKPIVPMKPSAKLNARVDPGMEPGQIPVR